jgi:putative protease
MVPLSVLGRIRKLMIEQLDASLPMPEIQLRKDSALDHMRAALPLRTIDAESPLLTIMCRSLEQLKELTNSSVTAGKPDRWIADFQDIREYREATRLARDSGTVLLLATPRIQKPDEMGLFRAMLKHKPDGVLVRNLSGLAFFRDNGIPVVGDYSLNVTNELTASFLMQQGLQWLTPSYDLNRDQLMELVRFVPPQWLEIVIHQHMPMFHMEHCVFCAMLSPGTNKTNCGRPCDVHRVELRDRTGVDHPLIADVGCRNTLFNAVAQSSAEIASDLLQAGVRRFRIELLQESPDEVRHLVSQYRRLLDGSVTGDVVWKSLDAMNRVGITRGTLESKRNPLAIL